METESVIANGQRFNQSCLCNEVAIEPQKEGVWRFWVVSTWVGDEWCTWPGVEGPRPFPHTLPSASLPSGYS